MSNTKREAATQLLKSSLEVLETQGHCQKELLKGQNPGTLATTKLVREHKAEVCSIGSVFVALVQDGFELSGARQHYPEHYYTAMRALSEAVSPRLAAYHGLTDPDALASLSSREPAFLVIDYNDDARTTTEDVKLAFKQAIHTLETETE